MIVHKHWKRLSQEGIRGQHIAIVGYSHYGDVSKDSSGFTNWALKKYLSGDQIGGRFFPPIQSYFGYEGRPEFWNRVHFFNFIPECFPSSDKFSSGDMNLVERARKRFLNILKVEKPDKVFIFTRKGWRQCPDTLERSRPLKSNHRDTWRTYNIDCHKVKVCGFRHPLYARAEDVKAGVQEFLAM